MTEIQANHLALFQGIGQVKFVRTDDVSFTAQTKQLALQRIFELGLTVFSFKYFLKGLKK